MSKENKNKFCKCNELADRLRASLKDNERLAKTIQDLGQENDDLQTKSRNRLSGSIKTRSVTTGDGNRYKEKFEALVEINHGWKKDYEELQMRYEMLSGEKRLLEDEEGKLKGRINEQQKRNKFLEGEIARLAAALYAQQGSNGRASPSEDQCELLKSQMVVYKDDFERERQDRQNLNEEKENYKNKFEHAEEIIRMLTAELDDCIALEQARKERKHYSENDDLSERARHQVQLVNPHHQVHETWRMEKHTLDNCIPDSLAQANNMRHYT